MNFPINNLLLRLFFLVIKNLNCGKIRKDKNERKKEMIKEKTKEKKYHTIPTTEEVIKQIKSNETHHLTLKKTKGYSHGDYIKLVLYGENKQEPIDFVCKKINYIMHSKGDLEQMTLGLNEGEIATLCKEKRWAV